MKLINPYRPLLLAAALLAVPATATADGGDYGPAKSGLRLAAAKVGSTLEFRLENTTERSITFVEGMSCTGHDAWSLDSKTTKVSGEERKHRRIDLGTNAKCKSNTATWRTVAPGKTAVVVVELPAGPNYASLRGGELHGRVKLVIDGRKRPVVLVTGPLSVDFDSFP